MTLSDLTDPQAVLKAIGEFDSLGRENFLKNYGFREAKIYFLLYHGSRYDSKAIVGAAYGKQYPERGPLLPKDFSGGESTVARRLRDLGFEIATAEKDQRSQKIWAFCANPNRYRILEAVRNLPIDYWTVGKSDVRAGDYAVIWQTLDKERRRGIVALGEVLDDPEPRTDFNQYWVNSEDGIEVKNRVPVRYLRPSNLPLWLDDTPDRKFLANLRVAKATGGTIFRVSPEEWEQIIYLTTEWSPVQRDIDVEEDEDEFPEGRVRYREHRFRERNRGLVLQAKANAIKKGALSCQVCGFDFYKTYGELGKGFIECHHTVPVSEYTNKKGTKLSELVLVCSNCHRMLHRRRPWLTISEISHLLSISN